MTELDATPHALSHTVNTLSSAPPDQFWTKRPFHFPTLSIYSFLGHWTYRTRLGIAQVPAEEAMANTDDSEGRGRVGLVFHIRL